MCSIGEEDFGDAGGAHTMMTESQFSASAIVSDEICKKCNASKVAVKLNLKDAQCESCFYQYVRHKMRASMGSTKIIERGAKVLLVFDTTIEACVMFDMIRYAMSMEQYKRLTIQPCAIYVDNTCVSGRTIEQRQQILSQIQQILQAFGFDTYYASIVPGVPLRKFDNTNFDDEQLLNEQNFVQKFNAIDNQTAKEDYQTIVNLNTYREAAAHIQCTYVFLPTISHQVATNLLVNVALGRGKSVANYISFCDNRTNCDAKIIRPMRNITLLEVETYVRFNKMLNQLIPKIDDINTLLIDTNPAQSIQSLTNKFIDNLQDNFASTVSTVFRTGDKISEAAAAAVAPTHNGIDTTKQQTCKFCHSELDFKHSNTLLAIEYSRCVSARADQCKMNDVTPLQKMAEHQMLGYNDDDTESLIKFLCHGCRNIFRDLNEPESYIN